MAIFKTIRMRLLIVPAAAIIAVLVTAFIGLYGLNVSRQALKESSKAKSAILYAKQADMMHDALRGDVLSALLSSQFGSEISRDETFADLEAHTLDIKAQISQLSALDLSPQLKGLIEAVTPPLETYVAQAQSIVTLAFTDPEQAKAQYPTFKEAFSDLEGSLEALGSSIEETGTLAADEKADHAGLLIFALGTWWLLCTAIFIATNWIISRGITGSIDRVSAAMQDVGDGKLDVAIADINNQGEIGRIARSLDGLREKLVVAESLSTERVKRQEELQKVTEALTVGLNDLAAGNFTRPISNRFPTEYEVLRNDFNLAVDKLNNAISRVASAAESIRARSAEVNRATDDLAHRTETQAATLEQTAAAMDQMTSSVKSSANSTKEVEAIVSQARREAEDSGSVVKSAVAAMVEIEKSSSHISQIIGVIDDIAFQTNLLALNAGVEAARAGDAGRGFAVVASEVGALAQRSSVAAKEIKNLISASTQHVGIGVDQVGQAGSALTSIVERVAQISNLVSNIASGASEQSTGLGEINVGVNQLDVATQQNAAMVEETTAASQLLSQNAAELSELMALFTVEGGIVIEPPVRVDVGHPVEPSGNGPRQRATARAARDADADASNGAAVWTDF